MKVRLQTTDATRFRGPLECAVQTVRLEGLRGLYKGASPPLVGWMFMDSVMLGSLSVYRRLLAENVRESDQVLGDLHALIAANALGADRLMDSMRVSVNLLGNCVATFVVAKWEGQFDREAMLRAFRGEITEAAESEVTASEVSESTTADGPPEVPSAVVPAGLR